MERIFNFSAGPAILPQEVLAQESLLHKRTAEQDSLTGIANRRAMEQG